MLANQNKRITQDDLELARRLFNRGLTNQQVGERIGRTTQAAQSIRKRLRADGEAIPRSPRSPRLNPAQERIVDRERPLTDADHFRALERSYREKCEKAKRLAEELEAVRAEIKEFKDRMWGTVALKPDEITEAGHES